MVKDLEKGCEGSRSQIQCVNLQAGRSSFMQFGHERKERKGQGLAEDMVGKSGSLFYKHRRNLLMDIVGAT